MMKKQGALVYDNNTGRYNIRFDLDKYYGGLHCCEFKDVKVRVKWIHTLILYVLGWYLVVFDKFILDGLMVRI